MSQIKTKVMSIEQGRYMYDRAAKIILSDVQILSRILHSFVPEFRSISIAEIEDNYIETRSISISEASVSDIAAGSCAVQKEDAVLLNSEDI